MFAGVHTDYSVRVDAERRETRRAFWEDDTVGLVLAELVRWAETVTVACAKPSSGAMLRDVDGLGHRELRPRGVANTVPRPENTPATGAPTIAGTARVGETLTASTADIEEADGLSRAAFAFQWAVRTLVVHEGEEFHRAWDVAVVRVGPDAIGRSM